MYKVSHMAVALFRKFPAVAPHVPMFLDKAPVDWGHDSPMLILRKSLRILVSTPLVVRVLESSAPKVRAPTVLNLKCTSSRFSAPSVVVPHLPSRLSRTCCCLAGSVASCQTGSQKAPRFCWLAPGSVPRFCWCSSRTFALHRAMWEDDPCSGPTLEADPVRDKETCYEESPLKVPNRLRLYRYWP